MKALRAGRHGPAARPCRHCGREVWAPIIVSGSGDRGTSFCSASCVFSEAVHGDLRPLRALERQRTQLVREIEAERRSRVITLIHRVELAGEKDQFITIEDSEEILQQIRSVADETPIDIVLHCPGGIVLAAEQIALALKEHPSKVTAIVPHYAMSGATLCSLAASEILMDPHAVLGPLDPQIGGFPAPSLVHLLQTKPVAAIGDEMLVLGDIASKALRQTQSFVVYLLRDRLGAAKATTVAEFLTGGYMTHDSPLVADQIRELGLPARVGIPPQVYGLMRLHKLSHPRPTPVHVGVS